MSEIIWHLPRSKPYEELILRDVQPGDLTGIAALYSDRKVMRYISKPVSGDMVQRLVIGVMTQQDIPEPHDHMKIKIINGRFAGISLLEVSRADKTTCYLTGINAPDFQGKGVSTQALPRMVELAKEIGIQKVRAVTHVHNTPIRKILAANKFRIVSRSDSRIWLTYELVIT